MGSFLPLFFGFHYCTKKIFLIRYMSFVLTSIVLQLHTTSQERNKNNQRNRNVKVATSKRMTRRKKKQRWRQRDRYKYINIKVTAHGLPLIHELQTDRGLLLSWDHTRAPAGRVHFRPKLFIKTKIKCKEQKKSVKTRKQNTVFTNVRKHYETGVRKGNIT